MKAYLKVNKTLSTSTTPYLLLFFVPLLFFVSGCTSYQMNSIWKDREIKIDGISTDWVGALALKGSEN